MATTASNETLHEYAPFLNIFPVASVLMVIASLVGASLLFVLLTSVKYRSRSYSVYLLFLAFSDLICIILSCLLDINDWFVGRFGMNIFYRHLESCVILEHGFIAANMCSSWFLVAVTVDRYICVMRPQNRATWCTMTRAIIVCVIISLVTTTFTLSGVLANIGDIVVSFESESKSCFAEAIPIMQGFYIFLMLFATLAIPVPIIVVLAVRLMRVLRRCDIESDIQPSLDMRGLQYIRHSAYVLVVMGIVCSLTLTPVMLFEMMELAGFEDDSTVAWKICNLVRSLNFCSKFYIIVVFSRTFRQDFGLICGWGPYSKRLHADDTREESDIQLNTYDS